jgi:carbon storage regulator CsrA
MRSILCNIGEEFKLSDDIEQIELVVFGINHNRVKIGINAPEHLQVFLAEVYNRIQAELIQQVEAHYYQVNNDLTSYVAMEQQQQVQKGKKWILLVEDNDLIRKVNANYLQMLGYKVDVAKDGRETFDLLHNKYDLILLDIGLPDISGLDICKKIRRDSDNCNTPIIFLTTYGDSYREKCILVGANDFAIKPLSMEKLHKLIKHWL